MGAIGGPDFFPQQSESQVCQDLLSHNNYTIFNYTFDTRKVVLMVEEVVVGKKENAKPLALRNFETKRMRELN